MARLQRSVSPSGGHRQKSNFQLRKPLRNGFLMRIDRSDIDHKTLRLPVKFVEEFGNELSETVNLILPDLHVCPVDLIKGKNNYLFDGNWDKFVKGCSIRHGFTLHFNYNGMSKGMSNFSVCIFDKDGLEVEYLPWNELNDDEEEEEVGETPEPERYKRRTPAKTPLKKNKPSPASDSGDQLHQNPNLGENVNLQSDSANDLRQFEIFNKLFNDKNQYLPAIIVSENFASQFANASHKTFRAVLEAYELRTKHVSFAVIIQKHNMHESKLFVPATFIKDYLPEPSKNITIIDCNGNKKWQVYRNRAKRVCLSKGWAEFANDCDLQIGDVCLMELVSVKQTVLQASLFHATSEGNSIIL